MWNIDHTQVATEAIKKVLKDDYAYDSTWTLRAMYRNFTQCQFVEDSVSSKPYSICVQLWGNAVRLLMIRNLIPG